LVLICLSAPSPSRRSIATTPGAYVSPVTLPVAFAPSELFGVPELLALPPPDESPFAHANITIVAHTATMPIARSRSADPMSSFEGENELHERIDTDAGQ
jgi:hypothetical protein